MTIAMAIGDPELEARITRAAAVGVRAIVLLTGEEDRALAVAEAIAERLDWPLRTWSVASGVDRSGRERELGSLLARLLGADEDELWLLFEPGRELRSSAQRRLLRELAQARRGPMLILVESEREAIPDIPELELLRLELPDFELLRERVIWLADELGAERPRLADALRAAADSIATAGRGLTLERFDRTIAEAALSEASTAASMVGAVEARRLADACGAVLERVETSDADERIGFGRYLAWLRERAPGFAAEPAAAGLRRARGVGLIGAPGCGLDLAVRMGARLLGLPLVRIGSSVAPDPASIGSLIAALERAAPVALWLDESAPDDLVDAIARWHAAREPGVALFVMVTRARELPDAWRSGDGVEAWFVLDLAERPPLAPGVASRLDALRRWAAELALDVDS